MQQFATVKLFPPLSQKNVKKLALSIAVFMTFLLVQVPALASGELVQALYGPVKTQKLAVVAEALRQMKLLEGIAEGLTKMTDWPVPLKLVGAECGQSNAYYLREHKTIILCYEMMVEVFDRIPKDARIRQFSDDRKNETAAGALVSLLFHEVGHALIDVYDLPTLGREEDVADQISTFVLLQLKGNDATSAILGGILFFDRGRQLFYLNSQRAMADEHALNPQRSMNIACWAYGFDKEKFSEIAKLLGLPQSRAPKCEGEYSRIVKAVKQLLGERLHF